MYVKVLRLFYGAYFLITIIIVGAHDCDSPVFLEGKLRKSLCDNVTLPSFLPFSPLKVIRST